MPRFSFFPHIRYVIYFSSYGDTVSPTSYCDSTDMSFIRWDEIKLNLSHTWKIHLLEQQNQVDKKTRESIKQSHFSAQSTKCCSK